MKCVTHIKVVTHNTLYIGRYRYRNMLNTVVYSKYDVKVFMYCIVNKMNCTHVLCNIQHYKQCICGNLKYMYNVIFVLCTDIHFQHAELVVNFCCSWLAFHFGQCFLAVSPYPIIFLLFSVFQLLQCRSFAEQTDGTNHRYLVIHPVA